MRDRCLRDQRGVALPIALIALVALTGLLLVFVRLASTEALISQSHTEITSARYLAEAGIEWAFDNLAGNADWNAGLLGADGLPNTADDGRLATGVSVTGLPVTYGTFSVTVRNDTQAGDTQITGLALDAGGAFADTNGRVIVSATGTKGTTTRTIQVVVSRVTLPPIVAALSLPGNESETTFNGNSFTVNGTDTNLDDTPGPESAVLGIAVAGGSTANEAVVQTSLSGAQKDNVVGLKQDPALPDGYGDNAIAPHASLSSAVITAFISAVKSRADLSLVSTPSSPLSFSSIGASCASDWASSTCWGTTSNPKIVYVKGDPDPTSAFSALQVSGTSSGAGILIVEDGDLRISGNFRWEGIVIVTGQWVGVGYMGGGWQTVYGAVISNETATDPGYKEALISGNAKLNYSSQAINNARASRKLLTVGTWREM